MVPLPVDYLFLTYLRYFSTLVANASWAEVYKSRSNSELLENFTVNLTLLENEACNASRRLKCELVSKSGQNLTSLVDQIQFVWQYKSSVRIVEPQIFAGANSQVVKINSTRENGEDSICCEIFAPDRSHSFGRNCVILGEIDENMTESHPDPKHVPVPHINLHAGLIQSRSAVIMWKSFENSNSTQPRDDGKELEYFLEYKLSKLDWSLATNISVQWEQNVVLVKELEPWSKYYFRVTTIHKSGGAFPSSPIVVVTPEDFPSGAVENVKVFVVNDHTLLVSWKPPPRQTWNGALLGYNIGYKRLRQDGDHSEDGDDEEISDLPTDSYSFIVLTSVELLGKLCEHEISVPETPYEVVVQAFNNVGPGPLSTPVLSSFPVPYGQ